MAASLPPWVKRNILDDTPKVPASLPSDKNADTETGADSPGLGPSIESLFQAPLSRATKRKGGPVDIGRNESVPVPVNRQVGSPPSWAPRLGSPEQTDSSRRVATPAPSSVVLPTFLKNLPAPEPAVNREVGGNNARSYRLDKDVVKDRILDNVRSYFDHLFGKGAKAGTSIQYRCPFHDDRSPSLSVSIATGGWKCHAASCGESGDVFSAWQKTKGRDFKTALRESAEWAGDPAVQPRRTISEARKRGGSVEITNATMLKTLKHAQEKILTSENVLAKLKDNYGVTRESVVRFGLGFDRKSYRLWIPVLHKGKVVAIRKHDIMRAHCVWVNEDRSVVKTKPEPGLKSYHGSDLCRSARPSKQGGKVIGVKGHNGLTLYPSAVLGTHKISLDENRTIDDRWICLTGGELKAVYLNQEGISATCFTGGEGNYTEDWIKRFSGLDVDVCMDSDDAGVAGAKKIADRLVKVARKVRIIKLPYGDVNDYYREKGWDFSDWWDLEREVIKDDSNRESPTVNFGDLRNAEMSGNEVQFRAIVAGSGETPHFVPSEIVAECSKGRVNPTQICKGCRLAEQGYRKEMKLPSEELIEIRSMSPRKQMKIIRENLLGIPKSCDHPEIATKTARIAEIGLVKDVDSAGDWDEESQGNWFVQKVYYLDKGDIPENEPVQCYGKIIPDPGDSRATMVLRRMVPVRRSFEATMVSKPTANYLESIPGGNGSVAEVAERMDYFVTEFEQRITHIYEQQALILGSLLLWFMPLKFKLYNKFNEKINAEALLIGDTRAGKTSVGRAMLRHFRAGRFVQCEGATFAGLVGGSGEHGSKKFFTWGVLPSQDGGFVLMDEIDDIVKSGVFSQLTSIRSDGIATRTIAGGQRQANARLRMLMASNPLGNRRMRSYSSVMYAVNELLKSPQDVARYEYAIGVFRPDDPAVYNVTPDERPSPYKTEFAAEHARWAWRQRPELKGSVADRVMEVSTEVSEKFKELVLLTASEARWKVARIASGIAALCYSQSGGKLVVNENHVETAGMFLHAIYGSENFAYEKFSKAGSVDTEEVREYLRKLRPVGIRFLHDNDSFGNDEIDLLTEGISNRREFLRELKLKSKCLQRHRAGYIKTQGFKDLLREMKDE